jgi:hypothetical protein
LCAPRRHCSEIDTAGPDLLDGKVRGRLLFAETSIAHADDALLAALSGGAGETSRRHTDGEFSDGPQYA